MLQLILVCSVIYWVPEPLCLLVCTRIVLILMKYKFIYSSEMQQHSTWAVKSKSWAVPAYQINWASGWQLLPLCSLSGGEAWAVPVGHSDPGLSGNGGPGFSWVTVQRSICRFGLGSCRPQNDEGCLETINKDQNLMASIIPFGLLVGWDSGRLSKLLNILEHHPFQYE